MARSSHAFGFSLGRLDEFLPLPEQAPSDIEYSKRLNRIDYDIYYSIYYEMNQLSSDVDLKTALARLRPERRAWVLTLDAEAGVSMDGLSGYFGNRGAEAELAAAGFESLGMSTEASAMREAISAMPRTKDGLPDYERYPLPDQTIEMLSKLEETIWASGSLARLKFAAAHPDLFFTESDTYYKPNPKPGNFTPAE